MNTLWGKISSLPFPTLAGFRRALSNTIPFQFEVKLSESLIIEHTVTAHTETLLFTGVTIFSLKEKWIVN